MWSLLAVVACLTVVAPLPASGEVFSSMATLRTMVAFQDVLLQNLETYLEEEETRLEKIRGLIKKKKQDWEEYERDQQRVLSSIYHPTAAYSLIRNWSFISDLVTSQSSNYNLDNSNYKYKVFLPNTNDRLGAAMALIRLQLTYNLTVDDLASGNALGHMSPKKLNGRDCYDIGSLALFRNMPVTALPWLQKALQDLPDDLPKTEVLYQIGQCYSRRSMFGEAVEYFRQAYDMDKSNNTLQAQYQSMLQIVEIHGNTSKYNYEDWFPLWKLNYEVLCRQDIPQTAFMHGAWCQYQTHTVPYAPYKMEVMHEDPWIVMYHDVLSDSESEQIKLLAAPELNRAVVGDPAKSYATEERVSKVSWLWDHLSGQFVKDLSKRVQQVTGLATTYREQYSNSEPFQVVNYGMGGQYEPHLDVYENEEHLANVPFFLKGTGDRVATFMFYLSDVTEGGGTVFPQLDVYVPPRKNSAAFWFNIHRNGTLDQRTQHAGCPVLVGEKWVANKWIREGGQLFRRPCGPTSTSTEPESRDYQDGQ